MEEQKTTNPTASMQSIISNFTIRTMERDLKMAAKAKKGVVEPAKMTLEIKTPLPEKTAPKTNPAQILVQAKNAFKQQLFEDAISLARQVLQDKSSSWLMIFRAKSLIKKSQKALSKTAPPSQAKIEPLTVAAPFNQKPKLTPEPIEPIKAVKPPVDLPLPKPPAAPPPPPPPSPTPTFKKEWTPPPPPPTLPKIEPEKEAPPTLPPKIIFKPPQTISQPTVSQKYESPTQKISYQPASSINLSQAKAPTDAAKTIGQPASDSKRSRNLLLIAGLAAVLITAIIAGYFFLKPAPPAPTPPQPETPHPSTALFPMDNWQKIEINGEITDVDLPSKIKSLGANITTPGQFTYIIVEQKINNEIKYPDLSQILKALGVDINQLNSPDLLNTIALDKYSLFLYSQSGTSTSVRLGLVAKLTDPVKAKQILNSSEEQMINVFAPLLLGASTKTTNKFQSNNNYPDAKIRFINFPENYSLDYVFWNDKLLIATSKESNLTALDRLLKFEARAGEVGQ